MTNATFEGRVGGRGGRGAWLRAALVAIAAALAGAAVPSQATQVAAGQTTSLWVKEDNTLWVWGDNFKGQLGDGTRVDRTAPVKLGGVGAIADVAGGAVHTVAVRTDGTVLAWGFNDHGQLGDGTTKAHILPAAVPGLANVASVAAGDSHTVALKNDGTVWTWGANADGEIGDGSTADRSAPVRAGTLSSVSTIGAGHFHSLAVRSDGTLWAWGQNTYGQLGDNSRTMRPAPVQVTGIGNVVAVAGGIAHTLALRSDGTVWAWGDNSDGQLGQGDFTPRLVPTQVGRLTGIVAVAAGFTFSAALKSDGTVWVWGYNGFGELGFQSNSAQVTTPTALSAVTNVAAIAAGDEHLLLYRNDGTVWASGLNLTGQLGDGSMIARSAPALYSGLSLVSSVAAGGSHTLAARIDGTVWAFGYNIYGQLGSGSEDASAAAVQAGSLTGVAQLAGGAAFSLALKSDGTVWSWGDNTNGQLGANTNGVERTSPAQVAGLSSIIQVAAGHSHSVALRLDGTVWVWGGNNYGQLGDGTNNDRSAPYQIPGLNGVIAIAATNYHTLALKADGTVRAWGFNRYGQLGDGSTVDRSSPVTVSGLTGATAIAAGAVHSVALLADGSVRAWGDNTTGELGDGTTLMRSSPVRSAGAANVTAITAGGFTTFAIRGDGALLAWGRGGMLGTGTDADVLVPTTLKFLRNVAKISSNLDHTVALTADGRLFAWGSNLGQELGIPYPQFSATPLKVKDTQSTRLLKPVLSILKNGSAVVHKATPGSFESADLVVEFFNPTITNGAGTPGIGHYFLTAVPEEAISIDNGGSGPGWQRTGRTFRAWNVQANAPAGAVGVCRFYARQPNSHFYTANAAECQSLRNLNPTNDAGLGWRYEGIAFYTMLPVGGACQAGYYPIYRSYNNRFNPNPALNDGNHRQTASYPDYQRSIRFFGYLDEGIVFCAPSSADAGADLQTAYVFPGAEVDAGSAVKAEYMYFNNGPGRGDGGTIYMALPAAVTNWIVSCAARGGATCPPSLDPNRLREGQVLATWPAGGGVTLTATGTAPQVAAGADARLEFATASARGNGNPDPTPDNDTPPPAQTVVRNADVCNYTLNPGNVSLSNAAQSTQVKLVARAGCAWTATTDTLWLTLGSASGSGNSTMALSVLPNPGAQPRTGSVTVNGKTVLVVQSGTLQSGAGACSSLRLQREGDQTPASGLTGATSVGVLADPQCGWSAQSNVPWLTLTSGGGGTGNGTVSYIAQPNADSGARSGTIAIGTKSFLVNQLGTGTDGGGSGGSDGGGDSGGSSGGDSGGDSG